MVDLNQIAEEIVKNLGSIGQATQKAMWDRACLYLKARDALKSDREFSSWVKSKFQLGPDSNLDKPSRVTVLVKSARLLEKEEFMTLSYGRLERVLNATAWKQDCEQMRALVKAAPNMKQEEIASAAAGVAAGSPFVAPPPKPVVLSVEDQFKLLKDEIAILKLTYIHSEEVFFHNNPELRQLQMDTLRKGGPYACLFFGLGGPGTFDKRELTTQYHRLSQMYHPDKPNGDAEIGELVNFLRGHFLNMLGFHKDMEERVGRAAKVAEWQERVEGARERMERRKAELGGQ